MSKRTVEPQYQAALETRESRGIASLGLMCNQVWHDDPRRLAFMAARYKFVAKMFSGRAKVAEAGCGDGFCARIVKQEVSSLSLFDFDPVFIEDINHRADANWPMQAIKHDLLAEPLPDAPYDGIYSLDVLEHIPPAQEKLFVQNLTRSLGKGGALIIGTPSLESQRYASAQSRQGHINCKNGEQLRELLLAHFHQVFLFSMNDEVVHTGFLPMAHYLLALCCEPR